MIFKKKKETPHYDLIYNYYLGDEPRTAHSFEEVAQMLKAHPTQFRLTDMSQFSAQEIHALGRIVSDHIKQFFK